MRVPTSARVNQNPALLIKHKWAPNELKQELLCLRNLEYRVYGGICSKITVSCLRTPLKNLRWRCVTRRRRLKRPAEALSGKSFQVPRQLKPNVMISKQRSRLLTLKCTLTDSLRSAGGKSRRRMRWKKRSLNIILKIESL